MELDLSFLSRLHTNPQTSALSRDKKLKSFVLLILCVVKNGGYPWRRTAAPPLHATPGRDLHAVHAPPCSTAAVVQIVRRLLTLLLKLTLILYEPPATRTRMSRRSAGLLGASPHRRVIISSPPASQAPRTLLDAPLARLPSPFIPR